MNEDMSQYLNVFLDEANEQMELLEQEILKLEQEPSQELLQAIFRAAHTLKGSSRAMGFTPMGELTHAMEDVFDKLRNDELTVGSALIDALFAGLDALKVMKEEIAATGATTLDTTVQTARLRAVLEGTPAPAQQAKPISEPTAPVEDIDFLASFQTVLAMEQLHALEAAQDTGLSIYGIRISVSEDCIMKSVRALMTLQALARAGSVLAATPNEDALDNEQFEREFEIVLATAETLESVRAVIDGITEVSVVLIAPWPTTGKTDDKRQTAEDSRRKPESVVPAEEKQSEVVTPKMSPIPTVKAEEDLPKAAPEKKTPIAQAPTVRVDVARLDKLLNLVGELVIDRTRIAQLSSRFEQAYQSSELLENLNETATHIGRITDELQEEIMKARMLPIDNVFSRFPRMIRDLAQKLEKEVNFVVVGKETELDRSVIEVIGDPLIHMLRNSVDHGIETPQERLQSGKPEAGTVWLRARHEENHIVIEIEDDGKGIDPERLRANAVKKGIMTQEAASRLTDREAINLIFASGFSTAAVVSDVSGRGVGMDIVKSNLERLGATVDIESKVGSGSSFKVKLPLTLAIIRGLLVRVWGGVYALPLSSVVETLKISREEIHVINHREVVVERGRTLPIVRLQDIFATRMQGDERRGAIPSAAVVKSGRNAKAGASGTEREAKKTTSLYLVVVGLGEKQVGLVVDSLVGEQEVVIKTLGKFIGDIQGISGATILGDGHVALIVDINGLVQCATETPSLTQRNNEEELAYAA